MSADATQQTARDRSGHFRAEINMATEHERFDHALAVIDIGCPALDQIQALGTTRIRESGARTAQRQCGS